VQLAIGHAATLEPAVKDLLHAVQVTLALLAGDRDVVYEVPVQVCHLQVHATCHQVQQQKMLTAFALYDTYIMLYIMCYII